MINRVNLLMQTREINTYTRKEEVYNSLTHGLGLLASCFGLGLLLVKAESVMSDTAFYASMVFGISMILCYGSSTLYHSFTNPRIKYAMNIIDHAAIYLLIAGTYTPFALFIVPGSAGTYLLIAIWTLAFLGILYKLFFMKYWPKFSLVFYLSMGWLVLFVIKPVINNLATPGLWLMVAGGVSYTVGVYFFVKDKIPYNHAIWHLFVLGGTLCHFLCIWLYVLPN